MKNIVSILIFFPLVMGINFYATGVAKADFLSEQKEAIELIQKYVATSDWNLRVKIFTAKEYSETVASRIFRGFEVISLNAMPCDEKDIVLAAWEEINRNPKYTLFVLEPIIREKMSNEEVTKYSGSSYPPVRSEHIDLFFNICINFALSPNGDFALQKLKALSLDSNSNISQKAKDAFEYCKHKIGRSGQIANTRDNRSDCFKDWLWEIKNNEER